MPIKFYTDTHISKAIAIQARQRGIDIVRCEDVGLNSAKDIEHLEYATAQGLTVITADADFPVLDKEWRAAGRKHAGIIYIQPSRKDEIGRIVDDLVFLHEAIEAGAATLDGDVYNRVTYK